MKLIEIIPTKENYNTDVFLKLPSSIITALTSANISYERLYNAFIQRYNSRYVKDPNEFLNMFNFYHQKYSIDLLNRTKLFDSPNFVNGVFVNSAGSEQKTTKPSSSDSFSDDLEDQVLSSGATNKSNVSDTLSSVSIMLEKTIIEAISYFVDCFDILFITPVRYAQDCYNNNDLSGILQVIQQLWDSNTYIYTQLAILQSNISTLNNAYLTLYNNAVNDVVAADDTIEVTQD